MAKTIKIAPKREEITRKGNVFSCEFAGKDIRWCLATDCSHMSKKLENQLKDCLSMAIAMSSYLWQVPFSLNKCINIKSEVYVNGEVVIYPDCKDDEKD